MLTKGMSHRLLVSNNLSFKTHMTTYGGKGFTHVFTEFISNDLIDQIMVKNP